MKDSRTALFALSNVATLMLQDLKYRFNLVATLQEDGRLYCTFFTETDVFEKGCRVVNFAFRNFRKKINLDFRSLPDFVLINTPATTSLLLKRENRYLTVAEKWLWTA